MKMRPKLIAGLVLIICLGAHPNSRAESEVQHPTPSHQSSCEESLDRAVTFMGFIKSSFEIGKVGIDELNELRSLLLSEPTAFEGTQPSSESLVERRMRARVFSALSNQLSKAQIDQIVGELTALIDSVARLQNDRFQVEEMTAPAHERLQFVSVEPGTTVMTHYARFSESLLSDYKIKVRVTRPFLVANMLVSQAQWRAVMGEWPPNQRMVSADSPVLGVPGAEVDRFVDRLNQILITKDSRLNSVMTGSPPGLFHFALLTNAQWHVFLDQFEEKAVDLVNSGHTELLRDETMKRTVIPLWTMRDPHIVGEDRYSHRMTGLALGNGNRKIGAGIHFDCAIRLALVNEPRTFYARYRLAYREGSSFLRKVLDWFKLN